MNWTPRIVPPAPTPCWLWEDRDMTSGDYEPRYCIECCRAVAQEKALIGCAPVCITCSLDLDLLPAMDRTPHDTRTLQQVALAYAAEKRRTHPETPRG